MPGIARRAQIVSAEFGQFAFVAAGKMVGELVSGEILRSLGEEQAELVLTTNPGGTYRKVVNMLELLQHRTQFSQISSRTLEDFVTKTGDEMMESLLKKADETLIREGFDPETLLPLDKTKLQIKLPDTDDDPSWREAVMKIVEAYNEGKPVNQQIKDEISIAQLERNPANVLIIRPDDIGVKRQLLLRGKNGEPGSKPTKTVQNTVIYVQRGSSSYVITATNKHDAYKLLLAFVLENGIKEGIPILFFADGAEDIKTAVAKYFEFYPHQLMLDWYHPQHKMRERISSSFKGTIKEKKDMLDSVKSILWAGNTDDAISYFKEISSERVKNQKTFDKLLGYLERNRPSIYSYALRKEFGYANASSLVEKANDLTVAQRQKHNGMAWSYPGSGSLAIISAVRINGALASWVRNRTIPLAFPA